MKITKDNFCSSPSFSKCSSPQVLPIPALQKPPVAALALGSATVAEAFATAPPRLPPEERQLFRWTGPTGLKPFWCSHSPKKLTKYPMKMPFEMLPFFGDWDHVHFWCSNVWVVSQFRIFTIFFVRRSQTKLPGLLTGKLNQPKVMLIRMRSQSLMPQTCIFWSFLSEIYVKSTVSFLYFSNHRREKLSKIFLNWILEWTLWIAMMFQQRWFSQGRFQAFLYPPCDKHGVTMFGNPRNTSESLVESKKQQQKERRIIFFFDHHSIKTTMFHCCSMFFFKRKNLSHKKKWVVPSFNQHGHGKSVLNRRPDGSRKAARRLPCNIWRTTWSPLEHWDLDGFCWEMALQN